MNNKHDQAFSIIMPVYNGENYLEEAIQSVIDQTYPNWELFIIDDGSSDRSLSISRAWEKGDKRIKVLQHPEGINRGVSASRNLGISFASGEWIAFLDADDYWVPYKLENENEVLKSEKDLALLYSQAEISDLTNSHNTGKVYGTGIKGLTTNPFPLLIKGFQGHISSVIINRRIITKNRIMFKEDMRFSEDTLFFHQVLLYGSIFYISEILSVYRLHNMSSCAAMTPDVRILGRYSVYERLLSDYDGTYSGIISFELVRTGMERIWKYFLKHPTQYFKLLIYAFNRTMKNRRVNFFHKLYLFTGPFPFLIKSSARKIFYF
jgi:hypothetical protein